MMVEKNQPHPIEALLGSPCPFLLKVWPALAEDGIVVAPGSIDHICHRVETEERYPELKKSLEDWGELLPETIIGGRPIATFKLAEPIRFADQEIPCIEIPAPKAGRVYAEGWEHVEIVIEADFSAFMQQHPQVPFDLRAANKAINPELVRDYEGFAVKFHHHTLEYVIRYLD